MMNFARRAGQVQVDPDPLTQPGIKALSCKYVLCMWCTAGTSPLCHVGTDRKHVSAQKKKSPELEFGDDRCICLR